MRVLPGAAAWSTGAVVASAGWFGLQEDQAASSTSLCPGPLQYDAGWKSIVAGELCPPVTPLMAKSGQQGCDLRCTSGPDGVRLFSFPVGEFDIDEQVELPAKTTIEGNSNPNDPADKRKKPDPKTQTYFVATHGVTDVNQPYCGTHGNMQQGEAQKFRIGFLLNSQTTVRNINFQGKDTTRPYDNGNLCGGGVFETPGCVSPGYGDGPGGGWKGRTQGCFDHTGGGNDLLLGDGKGAENVVIENVRLNDLYLPADASKYSGGQGSQTAVWVPITNDGSATKNLRITNLVSMLTRGDGINLHANVQDAVVEDCHIENTGDDIFAVWGAYEEPAGIVFRNNVGVNPGPTRDYMYGVCIAVYGARDVTFSGTQCYDVRSWNGKPNSNSCMAYVHDNWFGAIYPEGNKIRFEENSYMYMDAPTEAIPTDQRPLVKSDSPGAKIDNVPADPSSLTGRRLAETAASAAVEQVQPDVVHT
eukprot:TRINITY_DN16585_c0_g1_i2.p1 TRINITY_DN16585_c0_g1~~TRINITY_DN16585_c0_g1_i2.p1  ORF type:complete len:474 (+),score=66.19 TRINITY_DN16585_c0_g1_i2:90-1511(+)